MGQNSELLQEYKEQRKTLIKYIADNKKQVKKIDFDNLGGDVKSYYDSQYYLNLYYAEQRFSNLNWMLNNLEYTIKWLELGHEPGTYNGVENRFKVGENNG